MKKFIMMAAVVGTMAFGLVGCGAGDSAIGNSEETTVAEGETVAEDETIAEDETVAEGETAAEVETAAEGETAAN